MRPLPVLLAIFLAACSSGEGPRPPPAPAPRAGALRITEVSCRGDEWVEVTSLVDHATSLDGLTLSLAGAAEKAVLSGDLGPRERRILARFPFAIPCRRADLELGGAAPLDRAELRGALLRKATWSRLPEEGEAFVAGEPTPRAFNVPRADPSAPLFTETPLTVQLTVSGASLQQLANDGRTWVDAELEIEGIAERRPVQVKLKGNTTYRDLTAKPSIKVDLNRHGKEHEILGIEKLTLNNQILDPTWVREWLGFEVARLAGVPAPRVGWVRLRINGDDYGLYANVETIDDAFVRRWLGTGQHLYEGSGQDLRSTDVWTYSVEDGDPEERADLAALADALESRTGSFADDVGPFLHVDDVLSLWATEIIDGDVDGSLAPNNNYLHADDEGQFTFFPSSKDLSFREPLFPFLDPLYNASALWHACREDAPCQAELLARVEQLLAEPRLDAALDRAVAIAGTLMPEIESDPRKEQPIETTRAELEGLARWFDDRRAQFGPALGCTSDADADGWSCTLDCDDTRADVFPGAPDVCASGANEDCSGEADDACCTEVHHGTHGYTVCAGARTWSAARADCFRRGQQLARIDSQAEDTWVQEQAVPLASGPYWIGLVDVRGDGNRAWVDGTPLGWSPWGESPPILPQAYRCALAGEFWRLHVCEDRMPWVCEDRCEPGVACE